MPNREDEYTSMPDAVSPSPRDKVLEMYQKDREWGYIEPEMLKDRIPRFYNMLASLPRFGENGIVQKMLTFKSTQSDDSYYAVFFTTTHSYHIHCRDNGVGVKGYLGATMSNRTPRVGEDWTRGADLADGSFTKDTFHEIVLGIIGIEMKDLEI